VKCSVTLPRLPAPPLRPLLGAGASVGPIRAFLTAAVVCVSTPTAPPRMAELLPRSPEVSSLPPAVHAAPAVVAAAQGHPIPVPAPPALALFAAGVAALLIARKA
jgi:hypothetical protein